MVMVLFGTMESHHLVMLSPLLSPYRTVGVSRYLGSAIDLQGWLLRRCLTHINRVCGRTYRPRDPEIHRLCGLAGVEWPEPVPKRSGSSSSHLESPDEFDDDLGEEQEFESETDEAEDYEEEGQKQLCHLNT